MKEIRLSTLISIAIMLSVLAALPLAAAAFWGQVTFVKGAVTVVKSSGGQALPVKRGDILHGGDRVKSGENSKASLLLSDGSILVVPASSEVVLGQSPKSQSPQLQVVAKNLSKTLLSREGDNPMLKHLGGLRGEERNIALAPCKTKVKVGPTRLVWLPKVGVSKYAVTLMGPDDSLFESTVQGTDLLVPAEKLVPGVTYYWEVRDAALKDSITALGSGTFTTLEKKAEEEVSKLEKSISDAFPSGSAGADSTPLFLYYQVYIEKGMNLDALLRLDKISSIDPEDAEVKRWKRDLCKEMGIDEGSLPSISAAAR